MNPDGTGLETVAEGVRNSVGLDFDPRSGDLWFTDNQRDLLSDDMPFDELNHVTGPVRQHFGFPYCHSGLLVDPELGGDRRCSDFAAPAALLGAHAAPLGMRFYTGTQFPERYRGAIFVARHGPWNRQIKDADVAVAYLNDAREVVTVEPFLTGFVQDNDYVGRPVDVHVMKDGSLLVSDDHNGAIYRVSYVGEAAATARP
jgi:glucose/arabinose dehydrogenase